MILKKCLVQRLLVICFILSGYSAIAQIAVSPDGSVPDSSAMLEVKSTTRGFLAPRMSTGQRTTIDKPANGLLVYDITTSSFWFYKTEIGWKEMNTSYWLPDTNGINYSAGRVAIGTTTDPNVPLTIFHKNPTNNGNAVLELQSNDTWHTALTMFNGPVPGSKYYSFMITGPSNSTAVPGTFGLFNHNVSSWSYNINPTTNNMAIGSSGFFSKDAKSKLHLFNGDVNVDQIGSGVIMKSPNGNCWRFTPDNNGNLVGVAITCP